MESKFLQFMAAYGLSQYRLHKKTHFTRSQISEWMRGLHRPSLQSARRIAAGLGLPLAEVLARIEVRETVQNAVAPDGQFVPRRKHSPATSVETNDPLRTEGVYCMTCRRLMETGIKGLLTTA